MRASFFFVVILTTCVFSENISLSKDSLKVGNHLSSSPSDFLIIFNNSGDSIALDSVYLLLDDLDLTGMTDYLTSANKLEISWKENVNKSNFQWHLDTIEKNTYKLTKGYFYPNDAIPFRCAPNDSCDLHNFEIGIFLVSAHYPIFPLYIKGSLLLYFNNSETIEIALYSDDLRTNVSSEIRFRKSVAKGYAFKHVSLSGKRIRHSEKNASSMLIIYSNQDKVPVDKRLNILWTHE